MHTRFAGVWLALGLNRHARILELALRLQGGSDVRANTTRARPLLERSGQSVEVGTPFSLLGHKWFTSAPNSDAFLTLAVTNPRGDGYGTAPDGLSCFLVPRVLPDGRPNSGFRVMRLKDKLGDRSNGSSEVRLYLSASVCCALMCRQRA